MSTNRRHLLAILFAAATAMSTSASSQPRTTEPRLIHIVAERFTFTPSKITVEQGATVELRLTSDDTSHGFRLIGPGDINVEIPKRGRGDVRVTFNAEMPGKYVFECSQICGAGHDFMRGTLEVKAR